MNNLLIDENFRLIEKELADYYSSDLSEEEDTAQNRAIKRRIVSLLAGACASGDVATKQKALLLLAENTGCHEDLEILTEFIPDLIEKGYITQLEFDLLLQRSPANRWG
ncbi:MAG: hypothetical protein ACRCWJ_06915 [Casimicrobium sp.]